MKQVTVRDIPEKVEKAIRQEAEEKRLSINKAVVSLLERATEEQHAELHHDLDDLFGAWSVEEEQDFLQYIGPRVVDEEIWR